MSKIYALADSAGNIAAFYDSSLVNSVPKGAVEISLEQWQDAINNPGKWIIQNAELAINPKWTVPIKPGPAPDARGFRAAIAVDPNVPDTDKAAIIADARCAQFLWAIQDGNWDFAQTMYTSMYKNPGTGYTQADVAAFGADFKPYNLPLNPTPQ